MPGEEKDVYHIISAQERPVYKAHNPNTVGPDNTYDRNEKRKRERQKQPRKREKDVAGRVLQVWPSALAKPSSRQDTCATIANDLQSPC